MAAVAILGIVYSYLAKATSQGILTAGDSRWRMEASLAADEAFVELERELRTAFPLQLGQTTSQLGDFTISRQVDPFTPPPGLLPEVDPDSAAASLISGSANSPGILRRVAIRVSWFDGVQEQSLERITYAYDPAAAAAILGAGLPLGESGESELGEGRR